MPMPTVVAHWIQSVIVFLSSTELSHYIKEKSFWVWPTLETLHFTGMSVLIGTIGLFDLRVLGLARSIPPGALHRLIPWGIAAYLLNLCTGILFFIGNPDQYAFNIAFHFKLTFMALAGANLILFYSTVFRDIKTLPAGADAPTLGKVLTGISLFSWMSVIVCGRLLTWFRPLYFS